MRLLNPLVLSSRVAHRSAPRLGSGWGRLAGLLLLALVGCSDPPVEGCTTAADCADGQICRVDTCVTPAPCMGDVDCAAGTVCQGGLCLTTPCDDANPCTSGRICVAGQCGPGQTCSRDAECPGSRCDQLTGRCALPTADCGVGCADAGGCATDEQCAEGQYCGADGCAAGCRADGCGAGERCGVNHACVCAEDAACPAGQYCAADGACQPGCRDGDCPAGQKCEAESRACVCEGDAGCPADQFCASGECRPGCRVDGCDGGEVCDLERRTCGPAGGPCQRDLDCPPTDYCLEGAGCAPGCRADACERGQTCDLASRQCQCADDTGCGVGTWCDSGSCTPGCRVSGEGCATGQCDAATHQCRCDTDGQCVAGAYCGEGLCTPGCRTLPDDCEAGRCDPATHACAVGPCGRDADCPNGQACLLVVADGAPTLRCGPALAEGRAEAPCQVDVSCASRLCLEAGYCFSACERDGDCPSRRCVTVSIRVDAGEPVEFQSCAPAQVLCNADVDCPMGQACLPSGDDAVQPARPLMACRPGVGLAAGAACQRGAQCASGVCNDGTCWRPCAVGGVNHCPAGETCYPNQFHFVDDHGTPDLPADDRFWGMAGCEPSHGSDAACPAGRCGAGEVCTLRRNQLNQAFDQVCRTPAGASPGGGACRVAADCQTNLCFNNGVCLGLCDPRNPAGQCAAGTQCGLANIVVYDRDPANPDDDLLDEVNACFP